MGDLLRITRIPHAVFYYGTFLFFIIASLYMAIINMAAPFYRDASFFLFIANNIYSGQPPYWAAWDTKNPFVEYYWAAFYTPLAPLIGIVRASRVAEGVFVALTGIAVFLFVVFLYSRFAKDKESSPTRSAWLYGLTSGIFTIIALSDWRSTDNGLYLSIYQSLPGILALSLMISLTYKRSIPFAILLGVVVFIAWWTKQTSIAALAFPQAIAVFWAYKEGRLGKCLRDIIISISVFALLTLGFLFSLALNGTLYYYFRGAYMYNSRKMITHFPTAWKAICDNLTYWYSPHNAMVWTAVAFILLATGILIEVFIAKKRNTDIPLLYPRMLCLAWLGGCILECCLPMTFFPHYFLACWAPAIISLALFLASCVRLQKSFVFLNMLGLFIACLMVIMYASQSAVLTGQKNRMPIYNKVKEIMKVIPRNDTVFVWGGYMHYHVLCEKSSDYPQNMWWPYIMQSIPAPDRVHEVGKRLHSNPPDFVIEFYEEYLPQRGLDFFRLDPALLERWTEYKYELVLDLPRVNDTRLGVPARVFKRIGSLKPILESDVSIAHPESEFIP